MTLRDVFEHPRILETMDFMRALMEKGVPQERAVRIAETLTTTGQFIGYKELQEKVPDVIDQLAYYSALYEKSLCEGMFLEVLAGVAWGDIRDTPFDATAWVKAEAEKRRASAHRSYLQTLILMRSDLEQHEYNHELSIDQANAAIRAIAEIMS